MSQDIATQCHSPPEREQALAQLKHASVDVLVVGAGINGAVAAAALAHAGPTVAIVDRGDFASGVSSQSSNLAWGGIKYLETGEWGLVRKLCLSRNTLMAAYPSSVKEIRFFTSIRRGFRVWSFFVWLGALLYWALGNFHLSAPRYLRRSNILREAPVVAPEHIVGGLEYSDCYLVDNDSRFVFNFVRRAQDSGALAANYVSVESLKWHASQSLWHVQLRDRVTNDTFTLETRAVINATGPETDLLNSAVGVKTQHHHVLSKGIHLIVDRIASVDRVLTFFASDGRLFFVIPMGPKTCIGTTDTRVDTATVSVTDEDRQFVLDNANELLCLPKPLCQEDIIAERVGVRPLAISGAVRDHDWVQLSRKHELEVDHGRPFISVFGGKLTDCLNVGNEIVALVSNLGVAIPKAGRRWYGEAPAERKQAFMAAAHEMELDRLTPAKAAEPLSERFWRRYGEQAFGLLTTIKDNPARAKHVMCEAEYTYVELELIARREMIVTLEDFLRRRSKISQVVRLSNLKSDPGLLTAANLLFGTEDGQRVHADFISR